MGDLMRPMSFGSLMSWAMAELAQEGSIFGIKRQHFWRPGTPRTIQDSFGDTLAAPVGPAAGPQTQMAQNLLVAYLAGGRFMELKTVQKMDGEQIRTAVAKPCIDALDECYNCEWSTELTVQEAFDEYIKAYFAIAVFGIELGLGSVADVAFNMSVGYDLEGIKLPKIDDYIEGFKDASGTPVYQACKAWVEEHLPQFENFQRSDLDAIGPRLSNSVTLSTLHGCPASEIERIADHLLTEKHLNTFVKCNPTMLGHDFTRQALDRLGYDYIVFDDHHFNEDLQYDDAVAMFQRLQATAEQLGLNFGVKLTNTMPVDVTGDNLPADEMYMSGRSLLPLSMALAAKLSKAFDGRLPISYSGGIDAFSIAQVLATGIQPVTVATTLLKPGGANRFNQLASLAQQSMSDFHGIDVALLTRTVDDIFADPRSHKRFREKIGSRKTASALPFTDCFKAPCEDGGCPIHQQIPEYLALTADGRFDEAFDAIALDNTAPTILGVLCAQPCRTHCTRLDYDSSIDIRGVKLVASDNAQEAYLDRQRVPALRTGATVGIVGAGPAGIAAAIFLRRNGMGVEVYEKRDDPYGVVQYIIPKFRISREQIQRDYQLAVRLGVVFHFHTDPGYDVDALREKHSAVIVATGAWGQARKPVSEGQDKILDAFDFLWAFNNEQAPQLGRRVAVIGAGDVAMDCVRAAAGLPGVEDAVVVYRRNEANMPATQHEVDIVREAGLTIHQMLAPVSYDGVTLRCERNRLGAPDASGRRSVTGTGEFIEMAFDTVIGATGATIETGPYKANGLAMDERGRLVLDADFQSNKPGVYVIGDGRVGPATIVQAIADAKVTARAILGSQGIAADYDGPHPTVHQAPAPIYAKRGLLVDRLNGAAEGSRCLACQDICEVCTEVCPNRANVAITVPGFADPRQIVHIDGLCNECGDCGTFCPHAGRPYLDKPTIFWTEEDFTLSSNAGWLEIAPHKYLVRTLDGHVFEDDGGDHSTLPPDMARLLAEIELHHPHLLAPAHA